MKEITKLQVQAKDKNRVNVYLDNTFFGGLEMETAVKYNLKVGTYISEQKLEEIVTESEKHTAYNKALKLLSVRRKTQKEIADYLQSKGYLPATCVYVIGKLLEYHYIDDKSYVDSFVESHKSLMGKLKLKQTLMAKGVAPSLIDEKLDNDDFEQYQQIKVLAEKYMRSKEDTKENKVKLYRYLTSKGFLYDDIKTALNEDFE